MDSTSAIVVTPELQEVMREYTKAVMRDKPDNLLEYSQHWFVTKYTERRMAAYELESSTSDVFASLSGDVQDQIEDLFKRFDADSDSQLTIEELRVLTTQVELFSFFAEDTASLFSLLDLDSNDFVGWQEFSHAMAVWVKDFGAK